MTRLPSEELIRRARRIVLALAGEDKGGREVRVRVRIWERGEEEGER